MPKFFSIIFLLMGISAEAASFADLEVEGIVMPSRSVSLSLPVESILREITASEGAIVKKGQVLATLFSPVESLEKDRTAKQLRETAS